MNRPLGYGDKVLMLDNKQRRYLVTLAEGGEFHTHAGFVPHAEIVGRAEGTVVKSTIQPDTAVNGHLIILACFLPVRSDIGRLGNAACIV